jgi:hypothetical protein
LASAVGKKYQVFLFWLSDGIPVKRWDPEYLVTEDDDERQHRRQSIRYIHIRIKTGIFFYIFFISFSLFNNHMAGVFFFSLKHPMVLTFVLTTRHENASYILIVYILLHWRYSLNKYV